MTIEQEFFETFGIEPTIIQTILSCKECKYKSSRNCSDEGVAECPEEIEEVYPPITPEIVLGLEEILNREYNILIIECMANSTKITACPAPEQDWGCDEAYYRVYVEEKDLRTAILKVCSNYNVAISIQDQVKALFNK